MKNIIKKSLFTTACALVALWSVNAYGQKLTIATEGAYPPFNYVDSNNNLLGFDVDIGRALCEKMNVECEIIAQAWDGIIPGLVAGKYDAIIASMVPTEERSEMVDFTERYYTTRLVVAVAKDSTIADVSPGSMAGKSIGAQSGTAQANYIEENYGPAGATIKLYPTADEANIDMENSRLDAVVSDKFPLLFWLENDGSNCCKLLGELDGTEDPTSIAIRKNSEELKQQFNEAIQAIRADGTYDRLAKKYFKDDIY